MGDFKERLINEEIELRKKTEALHDFTKGNRIHKIDPLQKTLLQIQLETMRAYLKCLTSRIAAL